MKDTTHLCEHPDFWNTHVCLCRRTWNHPFTELLKAPETSTPLFDLEEL